MRTLIAATVIASALMPPQAATQSQADLLIRRANIVDVEGGRVIADQAVATLGDRIVSVGRDADIAGAWVGRQTIDAENRYLIPGLWDMHVHFGGGEALIDENQALLPLYVAHGVTTIRDASGDIPEQVLAWRQAIIEGSLFGPTLLTSGPKIEGIDPVWRGTLETGSRADVDTAIDQLRSLRVDFVKITSSTLSPDLFLYAVGRAQEAGLRTSGHVPKGVSMRQAVDAGLNSVEHLDYAYEAGTTDGDFDRARAMKEFRHLSKSNVFVTPTLNGLRIIAYLDENDHRNDSFLAYIGPGLRSTYEWRVQRAAQATTEQIAQRHARFEQIASTLPLLLEAGVTIMAGTDAGFLNSFNYPGIGLHDELELFVKRGLSPEDALMTATLAGPAWFGWLDRYGTVEVGKAADLVLLNRNPLEDIRATRDIYAVILRGRLHDRSALDAMLEQARASVAEWNVKAHGDARN